MIYEEFEERYRNLDYPRTGDVELRNKYREEVASIEVDFRNALQNEYVCRELGTVAESKLWWMAWENGHSSGYSEVENYYSELADLVNSI